MDDAFSLRTTLIVQQIVWEMIALGTLFRGWRRGTDRWDRATYAALAFGYVAFGAEVARWDVFSRSLRVLMFAPVALGSAALIARRAIHTNVKRGKAFWGRSVVVTGLATVVATIAVRTTPADALDLQFPLGTGRYYVVQGGSSVLVNYHRVNQAQQYALDITKLGTSTDRRAEGVLPMKPQLYYAFGTEVVSPCTGRVRYAHDGLDNSAIPSGNVAEPAGNYVAIDCNGTDSTVVLAHLQKASLRVRAGETVAVGQSVAIVGQSGHSSEPHLHIHAARFTDALGRRGTGVPLTFAGRFLVKNDVFSSTAQSVVR